MRIVLITLALALGPAAHAQLPEFGVPVPQLAMLDDIMQAYMSSNGIDSGVLAVSTQGRTVYQRGFGIGIEENTPMRLASLEKPITAAAARMLIADGALAWSDLAFDLGQPGGGILGHVPFSGLGDTRLRNITVQDLANHQGGWNRDTANLFGDLGDPQFLTLQISQAMGGSYPADRDDLIRYMLSQPLQFDPGSNGCSTRQGTMTFCYSNFGYMVLGRIVEIVSGMPLHDFVRARVLGADQWVPAGELIRGKSLRALGHPEEPFYQGQSNCLNIFDPSGPGVDCPYGNWHQQAFIGHGNLVAPVGPLLAFMNRYQVAVQMAAGRPLNPGELVNGGFNGALDGTSTRMRQSTQGYNIAVLFTRWDEVDHGFVVSELLADALDALGSNWPAMTVDGYWLDSRVPGNAEHLGAFDAPFRTLNQALSEGAGTRIRLMPATTLWTGTISHRVRFDAPLGAARIGG